MNKVAIGRVVPTYREHIHAKSAPGTSISTRCGFLTITDLNGFNGPAHTTNLGFRSSNLFGRAIKGRWY
jgi:hypothetical protein